MNVIDLDGVYRPISLKSVGPFYLQEQLIPEIFENGLAPGAKIRDSYQEYHVPNFDVFLEFSKITDSELQGSYLTRCFFEHRALGWSGKINQKSGRVVGYYFDGMTIDHTDQECLESIIYGQIYLDYIKSHPLFLELRNRDPKTLTILCQDPKASYALRYLLENSA